MVFSPQQKADCVLWHAEFKKFDVVFDCFQRKYGGQVPPLRSIYNWINKFKKTDSVNTMPRTGRPGISPGTRQHIK